VKLLEIQSSPRGESSGSITLTKSFIEACKSDNNSIIVDTLNVWHERLPEFDYEAIGSKYKAVNVRSVTQMPSSFRRFVRTAIPSPIQIETIPLRFISPRKCLLSRPIIRCALRNRA
jgi:FMN-dependent NADH-azoreductase